MSIEEGRKHEIIALRKEQLYVLSLLKGEKLDEAHSTWIDVCCIVKLLNFVCHV